MLYIKIKRYIKILPDINKDPSTNLVVEAVKAHKDTILDNYIASTRELSCASVTIFTTMGDQVVGVWLLQHLKICFSAFI